MVFETSAVKDNFTGLSLPPKCVTKIRTTLFPIHSSSCEAAHDHPTVKKYVRSFYLRISATIALIRRKKSAFAFSVVSITSSCVSG